MSDTLQPSEPAIDHLRAWFDPADAARYVGWSYRTFWRKVKAGLPVYYATDRTPTVYRQDIDAFQQGLSSAEMPSHRLGSKLRPRTAELSAGWPHGHGPH